MIINNSYSYVNERFIFCTLIDLHIIKDISKFYSILMVY